MSFTLPSALGAGALLLLPIGLSAQSLPLLHPGNPAAEARSGVYFQPYLSRGPGWRVAVGADYASVLELGFRFSLADTSFLLDAEALRLNLSVSRDLDARNFVLGEAYFGGSYDGFLDGFLDWYHGLLGIRIPEREARPRSTYAYQYKFADNRQLRFARQGAFLGDVRLGVGHRWSDRGQSVLSLTLPTNTAGDGYARGTVSASLLNTLRVPATPRLIYEGSAGLGITPAHGPLRALQREYFVLGTSGFRWRTFGGLWSFGNLYLHSPYYRNTDAGALDRWDFTVDFGWIIRDRRGREFRFGMSEDLSPSGPAVDATFRVGYGW